MKQKSKITPGDPKNESGLVQMIRMGKSIRHRWVKFNKTEKFILQSSPNTHLMRSFKCSFEYHDYDLDQNVRFLTLFLEIYYLKQLNSVSNKNDINLFVLSDKHMSHPRVSIMQYFTFTNSFH